MLVLGGDGMLGHQLLLSFGSKNEIKVTLRQDEENYHDYKLFNRKNSFYNVDVRNLDRLQQIFLDFKPDVVINAVGIVKQREESKVKIPSLEINALLPQYLAQMLENLNARLIHISTDCVFSGKKGNYHDADFSDAEDVYGKTKYLGEVDAPHALTLRTSIIGLELARKAGLIEWFLAQRGKIKGYRKAIYTGFTTLELCRVIELILKDFPNLTGVWNVASQAINKYELLNHLSHLLGRQDVEINADDTFICDRSLNGQAFINSTGYNPPNWPHMLSELSQQILARNDLIGMANKCIVQKY